MIFELSKVFYLLICLKIVVSESFIISKLLYKYRPLEAKNGDNFVKADFLLLVVNFAIDSLSD